jgi:hypothetical protein
LQPFLSKLNSISRSQRARYQSINSIASAALLA